MLLKYCFLLLCLLLGFTQCKSPGTQETLPSDDALMDTVQRRTFNYFWEGAEPNSGLARERIHMDGVYPENDRNVVTSGGSGFGIMAILAGIDRGYVTPEEGLQRPGTDSRDDRELPHRTAVEAIHEPPGRTEGTGETGILNR